MKVLFTTILYFFMIGCSKDDKDQYPKVKDTINISNPENDVAGKENRDPASQDRGHFTFLALGDSYTIGEGVKVEERWPNQLSYELNQNGISVDTVEIIAQTGWTTGNLLSAIDRREFKNSFDMVSLLIGVNNQYQRKNIAQYAAEFKSLLEIAVRLAGGNKNRVLVLSIPDYSVTPFASNTDTENISLELKEFNAVNREIAKDMDIAHFDITPISLEAKNNPSLLASDGLHPSGKMYKKWVDLIYEDIVMMLKE